MNNLLVSIILPTFKRSTLIKRAINSVLLQTYRNFELIIIDDNELNSQEEYKLIRVLEEFSDPRIKYYKNINKKGYGPATARNLGIQNANGEYIAFCDDDDIMLKDRIEKQYNILSKSSEEYGLVYGWEIIRNQNTNRIIRRHEPNKIGYIYYDMLRKNYISINVMIKKKVVDEIGEFRNLGSLEDYDYFIRITKKYKVILIPEYLSEVYVLEKSVTSNLSNHIKSREKIFELNKEFIIHNREIHSIHELKLAILYYKIKNFDESLQLCFSSFKKKIQAKSIVLIILNLFRKYLWKTN